MTVADESRPTLLDASEDSRIDTTVRPDGSPHTTPVWFCLIKDTWWLASATRSVKVRNVAADPRLSLALQGGSAPVVAEGHAVVHTKAFPDAVVAAFAAKYSGWDITAHQPDGPRVLMQVPVTRWLLSGIAP